MRNPEAKTWKQYTDELLAEQNGETSQQARPVNQKVVDKAVSELKDILGRKPSTTEVEEYLADRDEITGEPAPFNPLDPFGFMDIPTNPYTS